MQRLQYFYIGTYTQPIQFGTGEVMQGKGAGIYLGAIDRENGAVSGPLIKAGTANPSFLTFSEDGRFLYAVNELKSFEGREGGAVSAYQVMPDRSLALLGMQPTLGSDPCHLTADPQGSCVIAVNFMSGSVAVYPLCKDGNLAPMSQFHQHEGRSADPRRQCGPHAHSAVFDPSGDYILVPDLGVDAVFVYRLDRANCHLLPAGRYSAPVGAGPRYCEFHPTLPICYLINELDSSISALQFAADTGTLTHLATYSTLEEPFEGENICADLHISPNGKTLYGSNRGHDSLVVYRILEDGRLVHLQTISSGGRTPRNFALMPGNTFLIAANQDSDNLVVYQIDSNDGKLRPVGMVDLPSPVCVQPFRTDSN